MNLQSSSSDFGIDPARLEENWRSISADLDGARGRGFSSVRFVRSASRTTSLA